MKSAEPFDEPGRRRPPGTLLRVGLRLLAGFLAWIARHVRTFYGALGLFFVLGLAAVVGGVLLFAGLATLMKEGATQRVDEAVLLWMNRHANDWLDVAALEVTALGSSIVVGMTLLVTSGFLWTTRHRYSVLLLWVAVTGGSVLNMLLKASFDRPRPQLFEWRTPYAGHSSFPSGHAMTAMVAYATLGYLVARLEPTRRMRRLTLGVAAAVILLIGLSRMYLGVHYPSDVVAGYVVGFAWASFCTLGIEAVRHFRGRRPQAVSEEEGLEEGTEPLQDALRRHPDPEHGG